MNGTTADTLLAVVRVTHAELHRQSTPAAVEITLDSRLEGDLGFDSLARVELLLRIERAFGVALPEATLQHAETLRDLLAAVAAAPARAAPAGAMAAVVTQIAAAAGDAATPTTAATLLEVLDWHV
ncbi:acyl carrier protein, partial [Zoogloea ramigera]